MGDIKVENLKKDIITNFINEFNLQIDEVLSVCESEIEKLLLLNLFKYFSKFRENGSWFNKYYGIEFIEEEIMLGDPSVSRIENMKLRNRVKKYNHRYVKPMYFKNIGFRVKDGMSESFSGNEIAKSFTHISDIPSKEFEVLPQHLETIDGIEYRIDIAIILNRRKGEKIIETRKVALECDGYDYHSSPEQKMNDDIRTRKLKKSGWKEVLRYSGRELHSVRGQKEIHALFEEIVEVLYV